ncbi:MAG: hypothetical protein AB8B96_05890 [Lysobacterales bacterium]
MNANLVVASLDATRGGKTAGPRCLAAVLSLLLMVAMPVWAQSGAMLSLIDEALEQERDPGEVTGELLDQGYEPARAAQAVAAAWGDCNAAQAAVAVAVTRVPGSATDVVTAVGSADGCACGASSGWARSQLDQRIRFSSPQRPIALAQTCSCMAAAVEAGSAALPQMADAIVLAGVEALQTDTLARDSVGERGGSEDDSWLPNPDYRETTTYRRVPTACTADSNDDDDFELASQWVAATPGSVAPAHQCDGTDDDDNVADELLLREFSADATGGGHAWLVNHTDQPLDLAAAGYRLGIAYRDQAQASVVLPLIGEVEPGKGFLVAAQNSPLAEKANQVVPHLAMAPGDFLDLHQPVSVSNCECAEALTAAAYRGSRNRVAGTSAPSPAEHKMERLMGTHEYLSGYVVDSVGSVSDQADLSTPLFSADGATAQLGRRARMCGRDAFELDSFSADGWQRSAGLAGQRDCSVVQNDLVIADLLLLEEGRGALRLVNSSAGTIDMTEAGYFLEIYPPEAIRPRAEIPLTGELKPGESFVVAHDDIDETLRDQSDELDGDMTLAEASAVVLARRSFPRPLNCQLELAAFVASPVDVPLFFIEFTPIEERDPLAEPPRVDPLASPN